MEGVITAMTDTDFEVQVGNLRVRARQNDLRRSGEPDPQLPAEPVRISAARGSSGAPGTGSTGSASKTASSGTFYPSPGMELDLRGQRAEDALEALDRYLESAYLAGLPFVRIIHGKGTGRLRQVIRDALAQSPHVKSWEAGGDKEGGEGVTVAKLAV
jgi:DNA mismatch repair protein MutS2